MKASTPGLLVGLLLALVTLPPAPAREQAGWWPPEVGQALDRAGDNRPELVKALADTPPSQHRGMAFLVANMPDRDLRSLRADFLLENVRLAYQARAAAPWGSRLPEEVFLENVLPYANLDEARDPWRRQFHDLCRPLVKDCKTPAEAARRLNETVFKKLNVRYSTGRKKAPQSPRESIEQGLASCTGLSILLCDVCRSLAVPARVVGTPVWANQRGNHTWVEVWDGGWHFTGAAEPDPQGLDHAWFEHDASEAKKDSPQHAIYAAHFRRTGLAFPLVWDPRRTDVPAENVTDRYARPMPADPTRTRVLIRVWQPGQERRLSLPVTVVDAKKHEPVGRGDSRGETADTNDVLAFELQAGRDYLVQVGQPPQVERPFRTGTGKEQLLEVEVLATAPPPAVPLAPADPLRQVEKEARAFFAAGPAEQAAWRFDPALDRYLAGYDAVVRRAVWKAYQSAPVHAEVKKDFEQNQVRYDKHLSPYAVRKVGIRPRNGWPLFIAMHGGGGTSKEVNDSQWKGMQTYYRDQRAVPGYQYLALRAPNDTWNGFYDEYVPPLIINLIRQFLLFGDVDPDKVYLMGYSHGGYGAFYIGPKIPDRFAAIHASAAAPTEGAVSPRTLRNTRFTYMVGSLDNGYGRRERCEAFNRAVQALRRANPGAYPVFLELKRGFGHGSLPDQDKILEMYRFRRNPVPLRVTWEMTDGVVSHFFWLSVPEPGKGKVIDAAIHYNTVTITTKGLGPFDLGLDARLVNFGNPLRISVDGKIQVLTASPSLLTLCRSLAERGDPELACTCRIRLVAGSK